MTTSTPRMLTYTEVADALQVSKRTVYRIVRTGDLPVKRIGQRCSRIPEPAVAEYLENLRRSA